MHKETDRRATRSSVARFALDYQLEACRREASLWAMFVADHAGYLVAQVGDVDACEAVAAELPLVAKKAEVFSGTLPCEGRAYRIAMRRFAVEGRHFFACAVGRTGTTSLRELERSVSAAQRIMSWDAGP